MNPNLASALALCQQELLQENVNKTIPILLNLLNQYPDQPNFRGTGNIEDWQLQFPKGPTQWLAHTLDSANILNGFDLLNFCFSIKLHRKTATPAYLLDQYLKIGRQLGPRPELLVGRGHVYYEDEQYVMALECYSQAMK